MSAVKRLQPVLFLGLAVLSPGPALSQSPAESGAVRGIDVSHFSGEVDWQGVEAQGYTFAYVKATEGVDSKDPLFDEHWAALAQTGLLRGAYHFYVTEDDPQAQAHFFLETARPGPGDLLPVVDVEIIGHGTRPGLADRLHRFLEILEERLGVKPMIYTAPNFWGAHLTDDFGEHSLWLADYAETPRLPRGWDRWTLWQWRGEATVSGVEKDADLSRLHPEVELESLRIPSVLPAPESSPDGSM